MGSFCQQFRDVGTGAEVIAGPTQHDDPHVVVIGQRSARLPEPDPHVVRHRVPLGRTVEEDPPH